MPTSEELRVLRIEVEAVVDAANRLLEELAEARGRLSPDPTQEQLSHIGYLLHSIYTAWESAFHRIAATFENRLDPARWHEQLLLRMALSIPRIRPAVVQGETREHLAALKSFRHFFRHSYAVKLRWRKMQIPLEALDAAATTVNDSLLRFLVNVEDIADQAKEEES